MGFDQIWRHPAVESHIYPGLCLSDDRMSGSITVGCTRLPVWAFIGEAIRQGWSEVEKWYDIEEYGWDAEQASYFIYYLMEQRGEFGRLLLTLAEAERCEHSRGQRNRGGKPRSTIRKYVNSYRGVLKHWRKTNEHQNAAQAGNQVNRYPRRKVAGTG